MDTFWDRFNQLFWSALPGAAVMMIFIIPVLFIGWIALSRAEKKERLRILKLDQKYKRRLRKIKEDHRRDSFFGKE